MSTSFFVCRKSHDWCGQLKTLKDDTGQKHFKITHKTAIILVPICLTGIFNKLQMYNILTSVE